MKNILAPFSVLFLSLFFLFYAKYGYINNDAFYYFEGADFLKQRNLLDLIKNGYSIFSFFIYTISLLTNLDYYHSSLLINFLSIVTIFIIIKKLISYEDGLKSHNTDYLIILTLLISPFSSYYFMVIRDNLFVASMILFFLLFHHNRRLIHQRKDQRNHLSFLYFSDPKLLAYLGSYL